MWWSCSATPQAGTGESEVFLDQRAVYTDAAGRAAFTLQLARGRADRRIQNVTATVTSAEGATSPLSAPLRVP